MPNILSYVKFLKLDIKPFIREQIMLNECVILRGIGGFETTYREASYDSDKRVFHPPSKKINFHSDWVKDNGILESSLANALGIRRKKASEHIDDFVEDFHQQLKHQGYVNVKDLGEFKLDSTNNIVFKELEDEIYLADSFGLEDLSLEKDSSKPGAPPASRKKLHTFWYFVLGILVFLIIATVILLVTSSVGTRSSDLKTKNQDTNSDIIVFGSSTAEKDTVTRMIEKTLDEKSSVKQALSIQENMYEQTISEEATYYIIAGSFDTEKNASILKTQLLRKGFDPVVLVMGKNVRVVIGSFKNHDEALTELRRIRSELDQSVWLLTN